MHAIQPSDLSPKSQAQLLQKIREQQKTEEILNSIREDIDSGMVAKNQRLATLKYYQEQGTIQFLQINREFQLSDPYLDSDLKQHKAIKYRADFVYEILDSLPENPDPMDIDYWAKGYSGMLVVEEIRCKRRKTKPNKEKRHLMENKGYEVRRI